MGFSGPLSAFFSRLQIASLLCLYQWMILGWPFAGSFLSFLCHFINISRFRHSPLPLPSPPPLPLARRPSLFRLVPLRLQFAPPGFSAHPMDSRFTVLAKCCRIFPSGNCQNCGTPSGSKLYDRVGKMANRKKTFCDKFTNLKMSWQIIVSDLIRIPNYELSQKWSNYSSRSLQILC